jgi:S1-C subfamily serine protease
MLTRVPNRGRVRGVVIEQVRRNTDAWEAGLRPGDLIVALNRRVVRDLADFRSRFPVDEAVVLLEIRRRGNAYRVPLRLDDDD